MQKFPDLISRDPLRPSVVLAPMEGVVDPIMRKILTQIGGIDRCVTEFIRVTDRLNPPSVFYKYCPELKTQGKTVSGVPVFIQLLGGQAEPLADNAALAVELGAPGIDLNFGCPAKTVNRHDGGAVLLKSPERLFTIISTLQKRIGGQVPVTAKIRLGFNDKTQVFEIAQAVEAAGADLLTVHARTKEDGYRPPAYWEYIAQIKSVVSMPVVANGEIWSTADYLRCRDTSTCFNVALGRGLIARPDLGLQIKQQLLNLPVQALTWQELSQHLQQFIELSHSERGSAFALSRLKQWLKNLSRTYEEARILFDKVKVQTQFHTDLLSH